jgi:DNA polymerase (family 10)
MVSNQEISRLFNLYAELLLLHNKDERLASLLSGAAYRIRRMSDEVAVLSKDNASKLFRPEIVYVLETLSKNGTIEDLDELIQLTPSGLFEMMRIRGLGGKKLSLLWKTAKIDTLEGLLEAGKKNELRQIPGFGVKTEQNIIAAIETYSSSKARFHYASVADIGQALQREMQKIFKTKLVSLCGEIRRQSTTIERIEIIAAITAKKMSAKILRTSLYPSGNEGRPGRMGF